MGTITTMTVFVWMVNGLIFLAQLSMMNINPDYATSGVEFYSSDNSVLSEYINNDTIYMPDSNNISDQLQLGEDTSVTDTGGLFGLIDSVAAIKNWISKSINYFVNIVMGPYNILSSIPGLPKEFVGVISLIWYGGSLLLLILTIMGRNT